jgi:antitoxin (DNA-binding transcriptional repressor) of toxin-antitoxin stability system
MKRLDVSAAVEPLASYAAKLHDEILVVTKGRRPVAAIVPLANPNWDWSALSQHPEFKELLAALPDAPPTTRKRRAKRLKR